MLKYNSIKQELPYQLSSIDDSWYGIVDRHDMIVDRHVDMIVDRHVLSMFLVLNDEAIRNFSNYNLRKSDKLLLINNLDFD